ncbi:MAG: DUF1989 domain-containing protein [Gaiellales bacterium]
MAERIHIPPREGRAVRVAAGDRVRVIDTNGGQVADVFAFNAGDLSEYHSAEHTRVHVGRLFPRVGEAFVTQHRRPILTLEADDTPGIHDMLCAACDPDRYRLLGVPDHASCRTNLEQAMVAVGQPRVEIPQPINLFMNIPVGDDWTISFQPAPTRPGDSVTLRAELDCYVAVSACPQDIVGINAAELGPIDLEIVRAG